MTDTVRVHIWQDYETGDFHYDRVGDDYTSEYVFDIPAERYGEWERARLAWEDIGEALGVMHGARRDVVEAKREAERLRAEYEKARAAYEAHLTETGSETP